MHDAMPDADEPVVRELRSQKRDQVIERAVMAELRALGPRLLAAVVPSRPSRQSGAPCKSLRSGRAQCKLQLTVAS